MSRRCLLPSEGQCDGIELRPQRSLSPRGVLVVDVGGNSVKILASGHKVRRSFPSGPKMTPKGMVLGVKKLAADWAYEPYNLGRGWVGFDFARAFGRPCEGPQ